MRATGLRHLAHVPFPFDSKPFRCAVWAGNVKKRTRSGKASVRGSDEQHTQRCCIKEEDGDEDEEEKEDDERRSGKKTDVDTAQYRRRYHSAIRRHNIDIARTWSEI